MASQKPTIVFCPGAWHSPIHYRPLTDRLQQAGYEVHAAALPSVSDNPTTKGIDEDIATIVRLVEQAADEGKDVVLTAHSWGGVVAGSAAKGLSKDERQKQGKRGGIVHLVYICAFAPPEGVSLFQVTNGPDPWIDVQGPRLRCTRMDEIFYNDLPKDVIEEQVKHLKLQSYASLDSPATYAGWKFIPSSYLVCEKDNGIPVAAQEAMVSQPHAKFNVERCSASHSPYLSMPDFTAEFVRRAAGEQI